MGSEDADRIVQQRAQALASSTADRQAAAATRRAAAVKEQRRELLALVSRFLEREDQAGYINPGWVMVEVLEASRWGGTPKPRQRAAFTVAAWEETWKDATSTVRFRVLASGECLVQGAGRYDKTARPLNDDIPDPKVLPEIIDGLKRLLGIIEPEPIVEAGPSPTIACPECGGTTNQRMPEGTFVCLTNKKLFVQGYQTDGRTSVPAMVGQGSYLCGHEYTQKQGESVARVAAVNASRNRPSRLEQALDLRAGKVTAREPSGKLRTSCASDPRHEARYIAPDGHCWACFPRG